MPKVMWQKCCLKAIDVCSLSFYERMSGMENLRWRSATCLNSYDYTESPPGATQCANRTEARFACDKAGETTPVSLQQSCVKACAWLTEATLHGIKGVMLT